MVNFNNVEIIRAIMHRVNAKAGNNNATVVPSTQLLNLDEDAKQIIKKRLVTAFGRQSKSFELEIERDDANSCFANVNSLRGADDATFITLSEDIAHLLADSQRQSRIPGGFLMVVHCLYNNKSLYVLIKAEPHSALGVSQLNVQTIKNIILSPEQKLYKAAYFEQKNAETDNVALTKNDFRVVLFDSIVSSNSSIAQYFYKDFLGLTIRGNAELQTSLFYKKMDDKIWSELDEMQAVTASDLLRAEIMNKAQLTVNPHEVITSIIPLENRDSFIEDIIEEFPQSFAKNTSLITNKLSNKSILLSENVRITAPLEYFTANVQVEEGENSYVVTIRR